MTAEPTRSEKPAFGRPKRIFFFATVFYLRPFKRAAKARAAVTR